MSHDAATAPLLIELGCEEIPAGSAPVMAAALCERLVNTLDEAGLQHGEARWLGTPRRLTAHVSDVQLQQPDRTEEVVGPPASVAFDDAGEPTRAGSGFARGQGMTGADLYRVKTPKGEYAGLRKTVVGKTAAVVVADTLPAILRALPQPKKMRWLAGVDPFIRPVRWLVALLGEAVLPTDFGGHTATAVHEP